MCFHESSFQNSTIYGHISKFPTLVIFIENWEIRGLLFFALSASSTSEDAVINLLIQKRREILSNSKFLSQLPSHS